MANSIKYDLITQPLSLKKGNFWIGTNDVPKGPTNITGYWNGATPTSNGYVIYLNKESQSPSIYIASNDTELLTLTNIIAGTNYTTVNQCFNYYAGQTDKMVLNVEYPKIVTDGLVLNLDAGFVPSYPRNGNSWYDLSNNGNVGTLINSPTYSTDGGGSIVFDGIDDYITLGNPSSLNFGVGNFTLIFLTFRTANGFQGGSYVSKGDGTSLGFDFRDGNFFIHGSSGLIVQMGFTATNNVWEYHSLVFNRSSNPYVTYYRNGYSFAQSSTNNSGNINSNINTTRDFEIARSQAGGVNRYFNGNIPSVSMYNRALSSQEVLQNYNAGLTRFNTSNIVKSGLVLTLDASNIMSYPTSGTIWQDLSGYGNKGTLINGPTYSGGSIVFDGVDDYVNLGNAPINSSLSFTNGDFTLEHLIKPTGYEPGNYFGLTNMLISKGPASRYNYATQVTNETTLSFIHRNNAEGLIYLSFTVPSLTNKITHIVFSITLTQVLLYINGSLSGTQNLTGNPITPYDNDPILIGGVYSISNTNFTGNMYLHNIYNRPLSSTEVIQNYQSSLPKILNENIVTNGLVFYVDSGYNVSYPTTGTTWYDVSGYGRNGTLTNGPTYSTDGGGSIVFDGVDDFCPTQSFALSSQTNSLTFNFWVKMSGSTSQTQLFMGKDGYGFPHISIGRVNNDNLRFNFQQGPGQYSGFFTGTSNIWVNVQIVVTYGNATAKAYKNGVYFGVTNGSSPQNFPYTNTPILIGGLGYGAYLNGGMSIVQIYDRALSPDEVLQNYNATKSRFGL